MAIRSRTGRRPSWGWKPRNPEDGLSNPRPPATPATLRLSLPEYFAAAAAIGLLASQGEEPDQKWVCHWSFGMGERMAAEAKRRRRRLTGRSKKER